MTNKATPRARTRSRKPEPALAEQEAQTPATPGPEAEQAAEAPPAANDAPTDVALMFNTVKEAQAAAKSGVQMGAFILIRELEVAGKEEAAIVNMGGQPVLFVGGFKDSVIRAILRGMNEGYNQGVVAGRVNARSTIMAALGFVPGEGGNGLNFQPANA
jgi:hypothetical protein